MINNRGHLVCFGIICINHKTVFIFTTTPCEKMRLLIPQSNQSLGSDQKLVWNTALTPLTLVVCWLVGCSRFNGPLRQYFSLYRAGFCLVE